MRIMVLKVCKASLCREAADLYEGH